MSITASVILLLAVIALNSFLLTLKIYIYAMASWDYYCQANFWRAYRERLPTLISYSFQSLYNPRKWPRPKQTSYDKSLALIRGFHTAALPFLVTAGFVLGVNLWIGSFLPDDPLRYLLVNLNNGLLTLKSWRFDFLARNLPYLWTGLVITIFFFSLCLGWYVNVKPLRKTITFVMAFLSILMNLSFFGSVTGQRQQQVEKRLKSLRFQIVKVHADIYEQVDELVRDEVLLEMWSDADQQIIDATSQYVDSLAQYEKNFVSEYQSDIIKDSKRGEFDIDDDINDPDQPDDPIIDPSSLYYRPYEKLIREFRKTHELVRFSGFTNLAQTKTQNPVTVREETVKWEVSDPPSTKSYLGSQDSWSLQKGKRLKTKIQAASEEQSLEITKKRIDPKFQEIYNEAWELLKNEGKEALKAAAGEDWTLAYELIVEPLLSYENVLSVKQRIQQVMSKISIRGPDNPRELASPHKEVERNPKKSFLRVQENFKRTFKHLSSIKTFTARKIRSIKEKRLKEKFEYLLVERRKKRTQLEKLWRKEFIEPLVESNIPTDEIRVENLKRALMQTIIKSYSETGIENQVSFLNSRIQLIEDNKKRIRRFGRITSGICSRCGLPLVVPNPACR